MLPTVHFPFQVLINRFMLPRQPKDYAADVCGDGRLRNQFSNIILMLESGLGLEFFQKSVDKAVAHHAVDYHIKIEAGSSRATVLLLQGADSSSHFSFSGTFHGQEFISDDPVKTR